MVCRCSSNGGLHLSIFHSGNEQCTNSVPCTCSDDYHPTWFDCSNLCGNNSCRWLLHYYWKLLPTADHCQEWRRQCNVSIGMHVHVKFDTTDVIKLIHIYNLQSQLDCSAALMLIPTNNCQTNLYICAYNMHAYYTASNLCCTAIYVYSDIGPFLYTVHRIQEAKK